MQRLAQLFCRIDQTNRTGEKVAALEAYFREAPPADAAWALWVLTGRRAKRAVTHTQLRRWAAEAAGVPLWLLDDCLEAVGDLSETLALLIPDTVGDAPPELSLHEVMEQRILPLPRMSDDEKRQTLVQTWRMLDTWGRFIYYKLIGGEFRMGVSAILVTRALANVAGIDPAVMTHRLSGDWKPTAADYARLVGRKSHDDPARPYPFFLAHSIEDAAGIDMADPGLALGDVSQWQAEWKWDGIRAQLIHRRAATLLWSRGEELVNRTFPEIIAASQSLPIGTVLDGEVLAWLGDRPMPFASLQRRLGRRDVQPTLFEPEVPIVFMAYDLLERGGDDVRSKSMSERRAMLESLLASVEEKHLRLSPLIVAESWFDLAEHRRAAREIGAEGVMLKHRDSAYGVGRRKGAWWKWKANPFTVDAVLIYAQQGHGERAGLFSDYTFGVWDDGRLVPVAKAYSGLTDAELREVDAFVKAHTIGRSGPIRTVEPRLVFELGFEGIAESTRHRSGVALRFPRMLRWRTDKTPEEADHLETLRNLLRHPPHVAGAHRTTMGG